MKCAIYPRKTDARRVRGKWRSETDGDEEKNGQRKTYIATDACAKIYVRWEKDV